MRALVLVWLVACGASSDPKTNFELMHRFDYRGPRKPYPTYVEGLVDVCCPLEPWDPIVVRLVPEHDAACRALQWNVESGGSAPSIPWGPECHEAVSTESLITGLKHPERTQRVAIARLLAERDPSAHLQRAMFRELLTLRVPTEEPGVDDTLVEALTIALAAGGDDELQSIAESLHSNDATERLWSTHVMARAMAFPLALPELGSTLEALTHDPDWRTRERARRATAEHRKWYGMDRDSTAGDIAGISIPADHDSPHAPFNDLTRYRSDRDQSRNVLATTLLARRRFFCDSKVATAILAMLEHSDDMRASHLAKHARRLRWERCMAKQ